MIDPKDDPELRGKHTHPEYSEENKVAKSKIENRWRDRMHSHLLRMSRGAQNFFTSWHWPHKDNWRRKDKKK